MKYSLCLTNYNRYEMLIESFAQVIDDDRIDEILVSDDCSNVEIYNKLVRHFLGIEKFSMWRNPENIGMYRNKMKVVANAKNDYCILFDSDNTLTPAYLDAMEGMFMDERTVFLPTWAQMDFDYRAFSKKTYHAGNIGELLKYPMGDCAINTGNFIINKNDLPYEVNTEVKGCDSAWINYLLLRAGYKLYFVENMFYTHRKSDDSEWLKNAHYNMAHYQKLKQLILNLK